MRDVTGEQNREARVYWRQDVREVIRDIGSRRQLGRLGGNKG
jgi:hypothetical protein